MPKPPRRVIFLDFDGCLKLTHPAVEHALETYYMEQFGASAEEAARHRIETFAEFGCSLTGMARRFGRDDAWVKSSYLEVAARSSARYLATVPPCPLIPGMLERLIDQGNIPAIISQNHRTSILPILEARNLLRFIPEERVFDRTRTNGGDKRTEEPYRIAMAALPAEAYTMADDLPANLAAAYILGMHTTVIGGMKPLPSQNWHINWQEPRIQTYLTALLDGPLALAA